eukprot:TRINITY_DN981_c0_g1_i2.p1 TRINITY_DN981_c0_g1~~TRINITY_DN981_c0_g1_i2.p1  ORF type:complete len:166 (+),score=48.23 TRINITY_DN981_c0_g1_i2:60-557(+)
MGRIRTKTVKKASRQVVEKYYPRLTLDFQTNKKLVEEVAIIASKRLRNKIAGFTTHLMKRIQRGPVHGISFRMQEEERERRDNYVPDVSAVQIDSIDIDLDTKNLLKSLNLDKLSGLNVTGVARDGDRPQYNRDRPQGERRERRQPREPRDRPAAVTATAEPASS